MTIQRLHHRISERWYNGLWMILGLLLAGVLLFTAKVEADRYKQIKMDSFRAQFADLAQASKTIIDGKLTPLDHALLVLRDAYVAAPKSFTDIIQQMRSGPIADREILVVLLDREGYLMYTDALDVAPRLYLGERMYFRFFADGGKNILYVDEPVFDRVTKRCNLTLARPIYDKQGGFLGVIAFSVNHESLADFSSNMQLLGDTTITAVNSGGAVISRSKDFSTIHGTKILPELLASMLKGVKGVFWNRTNADGTERLIAYHRIQNCETPLIIYVETSAVDVLHETSLYRTFLMWSAGFISLGIMALIAMYLKGRKTTIQLIDTLHKSKTQEYEILTGTSLDGFWIADSSDRILDANVTFCKMLGYTQEDVLNLNMNEIDASNSPGQITAYVHTVKEVGSDRFESRCQRKDGTIIDVEISVQYVNQFGGRFFCFIRDITEHKRVEEALQESEEKYRTVADFTYDMETWRTPDGTFRYVSPSCERITGHTVADFLADPNHLIKITHPDDQSKVIQHYQLTHQSDRTENGEIDFRILTPGGDIHWLAHSCTAVHGRDGQYLGRRESNRDITKRKQAEDDKEKLKLQNWQLQKVKSLDRMAGAIAHHFNNKLFVVMGHLELALSSLPQNHTNINALTAALQAADKAAEVSRLMLTYLGKATGTREPLDLSETCRRSLTMIQATIPKNVVLGITLPSPGPTITANSNQVQMILTNLINNSREAVGDNQGTIQLTVKTVSPSDIPISFRFPITWQPEDPSYACLEVGDTGCGIVTNDIEDLFDPFFSRKFTGRGLGLPVVLGLVQAHSGAITVESAPGQGSVFRVFFPISAVEVPFKPGKAANIGKIEWFGTVLLVDDDEMVLNITRSILTILGFEVLSARDGIEAVEIFQQHKNVIRFVLTDFAMPRMNGLETLTALRKITPGIPVILASGYSEDEVIDDTLPERPQAFLEKPYDLQTLEDAIYRTMANKSCNV